MCKVLIVEPHGDDALCSCSSVLINNNLSIDIVTLGSSRSSEDMKELFPSINNVLYADLQELDYSLRPKITTHEIHRKFLEGVNVYSLYKTLTIFNTSERDYTKIKDLACDFIKSIHPQFKNYDYILYPLGLVHPYHLLVHSVMNYFCRGRKPCRSILYADKPYLGNRYARECMEAYTNFNKLKRLSVDYGDRSDIVSTALKKVYPTEVSMLRFSSDVLLNQPDIYLSEELTFKEDLFNEAVVYNAI